jgi:hypothetical protein
MMLEAAKVDEEREEEKKKDEALLTSLSDVSTAIQAQTAELVKLSESLDQKEHEMQSKSLVSAQIASSLTEQVRGTMDGAAYSLCLDDKATDMCDWRCFCRRRCSRLPS